ncbi:CLUMA_CG010729, isoform A [Clunio marinus]|uniref:CLUMA_CG010729, isoform A n=1 Tax=Clunio marinus TaxID=568069 RepID=A0A1J1IAR5_9DIPT|nr:CLUMA_CG010729, isoform A [Clunio marinus]
MLKSFMYIKNYKRVIIILAFFLVYISMYLIHNAYGTLCVIKSNSGDNGSSNKRDIEASKLFKGNNSNLFDLYSNVTTSMPGHKTEPHDETSFRDNNNNTHVEYEWTTNIDLDDIFISVKTTQKYHDSRLKAIVKTWFQLARDQVWFFTDYEDDAYQNLTNHHMVQTNCSRGHFRQGLCCKMNKEFDFFLSTSKKFWCHFDDDNYVNIPTLVRVLKEYHAYQDWYLGKPSISSPIEIFLNPAIKSLESKKRAKDNQENQKIKFWFATGGAGFCISRALAIKMMPLASNGKFVTIGDKIRFPDDVTLGFIVEYLLKVPLTVVNSFHSHLERMDHIDVDSFRDQISFSYANIKDDWNVVRIDGFDAGEDPYRFFSLHCYLFPYFDYCKNRSLL